MLIVLQKIKSYPVKIIFYLLIYSICFTACGQKDTLDPLTGISLGIVGDPADVKTQTQFGVVLMGGSTDVDEAMRWMIDRSGGGDVIILRATGSTGYNTYLYNLGQVNSVETLLIDTREKANLPAVGARIKAAEMVFIAGGDQARYMGAWSDTEVSRALQFLIDEKKVPIGGTSAGCAILGEYVFDAVNGSITSAEALSNPIDQRISIRKSLVDIPLLRGIITDQHYTQRDRQARHVVFLAFLAQSGIHAKGIGVDEKTAVCIDESGNTTIEGLFGVYFLKTNASVPERWQSGSVLHWQQDERVIRADIFQAQPNDKSGINLLNWPLVTPTEYWHVDEGRLVRKRS